MVTCTTPKKFILFVVDGAADFPSPALGGRTALEAARCPAMDRLAASGTLGLAKTIPDGQAAGTDVALLVLFGHDCGSPWGRGALEAAGYGLDTSGYSDVLRCNLVTLSPSGILVSHAVNGITESEGRALVQRVCRDAAASSIMKNTGVKLFPGEGFRHLMATNDGWSGFPPPHESLGQPVPSPPQPWASLLARASAILSHAGGRVSLWPWGGGPAPSLRSFAGRFDLAGDCVSAVPVVKGIARLADLDVVDVPGATGRRDTDWIAKVDAALASTLPFTLLHLEAPDECSHSKDAPGKVSAIEMADRMLHRLMARLESRTPHYRLMLLADHYTSSTTGRHHHAPVPFALYDNKADTRCGAGAPRTAFTEADAAATGLLVEAGRLLESLLAAPPSVGN